MTNKNKPLTLGDLFELDDVDFAEAVSTVDPEPEPPAIEQHLRGLMIPQTPPAGPSGLDPRLPPPTPGAAEGSCPCCGAFPQDPYDVHLSAQMIVMLQWIRGNPDLKIQQSAPRGLLRAQQHGKLKHWGLATDLSGDGSGRRSGIWRITSLGQDFLGGAVAIPASATVWRNRVQSWSSQLVRVTDF